MSRFAPGARVLHRHNPDLGVGIVRKVEGRTAIVEFPSAATTLRVSIGSGVLAPLVFRRGGRARIGVSGEIVVLDEVGTDGHARLEDGRRLALEELCPVVPGDSPWERLATGDVDGLEAVALRLDALHLAGVREAAGLGSFLGGRIRLFPHQLHVAERATRTDPVRWLLADEVGLGKTVEACLILNRLKRTGRAERTLVVAPETLAVQWLGELWRKYHQVFVLLDDRRLADVERDFGRGFNPFDVHRSVVVALERLGDRPRLVEQAVAAGIDLLIVDEAHRLRRPPGHPGDLAYRAVRPIADLGRHVLLLTATPLEEDWHGFFRLLELLRPEEFPDAVDFERRLAAGAPLPPCTSATRRDDIGGLPPRVGVAVPIPEEHWGEQARLEATLRGQPAENPLARREKARRVRRALAAGIALERDWRAAWLGRMARAWRDDGDKTLVFVAEREALEGLRTLVGRAAGIRIGIFHEDLSQGQADIEVAQFRSPGGPSMLISTECGGEGRNFEFCTRLVLFDLPWSPLTVEQRIGRLDRIGRDREVEIVYFRPPEGLGATVVALYESLGIFARPLGSVERELAGVEAAIEELAVAAPAELEQFGAARFARIVDEARDAWERVRRAAYHELHRESFRPEMAESILARVPDDLDALTEEVVLGAAERLELHVEPHRDGARHSIELGPGARVESLPGVPPRSSFLGSFRREEAVADESIDYFAAGHPLVEGLLAWLEESPLGRAGLLDVGGRGGAGGFGVLALYKSGATLEAVALDATGRERPEWAELLMRRPLRSRRVQAETWTDQPDWPWLVRRLARALEARGTPVAVAAIRVG